MMTGRRMALVPCVVVFVAAVGAFGTGAVVKLHPLNTCVRGCRTLHTDVFKIINALLRQRS